jgi:hypothetical protein
MAIAEWITQLRALGYDAAQFCAPNILAFGFEVPVGRLVGQQARIAIAVPDDPLTPPTGPHVSPCLLPIHPDQTVGHPVGGVHPAPHLGADWQYWSRPFPGWVQTSRDAAAYLAHIRHLFATL